MDLLLKLSLIPSSILGGVLMYKSYYSVPKYKGNEDLTGKVAIVTGGSSGIGQEIAYRLSMQQATVVLACRNMNDCKIKRQKMSEKTKNKNIFCSELDLESYESINNFSRRLKKKMQHVDILVHNAGYRAGDKREISKEFVEKQLAVNTIGPFLLTKLLLPVLQASAGAARVLFLVCPQYAAGCIDTDDINQLRDYDKAKSFSQSQLMRVLLMRRLSATVAPQTVTFNAVDPGPTYSNFQRNANYHSNIVSRMIFRLINVLILRHVWQAAETPLMCCASDEVGAVSGRLYKDLQAVEVGEAALDAAMAAFVYGLCDKWSAGAVSRLENKLAL